MSITATGVVRCLSFHHVCRYKSWDYGCTILWIAALNLRMLPLRSMRTITANFNAVSQLHYHNLLVGGYPLPLCMTNETVIMATFYAKKVAGVKSSLYEHYTVAREGVRCFKKNDSYV